MKLYAGLGQYLPDGVKDNTTRIDIEKNGTVLTAIGKFNLPEERIHLVLLNGVYLHPGERLTARLHQGDTLAIWPPVAGG